jgi:hypothetical protein
MYIKRKKKREIYVNGVSFFFFFMSIHFQHIFPFSTILPESLLGTGLHQLTPYLPQSTKSIPTRLGSPRPNPDETTSGLDEIKAWGVPYFQSSTRSSADRV